MKFFLKTLLLFGIVFTLTGCSLFGKETAVGDPKGIFKSGDAGESFEEKSAVSEKETISGVSVLVAEFFPNDPNKIFIGTKNSGAFLTRNAGDSWQRILPAQNIYAISIASNETSDIYVTGVFSGRGKIVKSMDDTQTWQDVFVEPAGETFIAGLAVDPFNPQVVWAGNTRGVLYKTENGGETWQNVGLLGGPIINLKIDRFDNQNIYIKVFQKGVFKIDANSRFSIEEFNNENQNPSGPRIVNVSGQMPGGSDGGNPLALKLDPERGGVLYISTAKGIFLSEDSGFSWRKLPTLEKPGDVSIRALAIGGADSQIIYYGASGSFYKSTDRGTSWEVMQFKTNHTIEVVELNPNDPNIIYVGIREFK